MHDYCGDCPRRVKQLPGHSGAVMGVGAHTSPIMVVGMSPGREELSRGEPFVGASGHLLKVHGGKAGLFRENCRILNTVCCWPAGGVGGKNLTPKQIKACGVGLEEQINKSSCEVILCLGAEAFDAVTGLITQEKAQEKVHSKREGHRAKPVGITQWRGYLIEPKDCAGVERAVTRPTGEMYKTAGTCPTCKGGADILGCTYCNGTGRRKAGDPRLHNVTITVPRSFPSSLRWIVGTYHPSFIMRTGMKMLPAFVNDVDRVMRALRGDLDIVTVQFESALS